MTRPHRRDWKVKNASVITGLRLEPAIASQLCYAAREHAVDERGRGDVAQMARYFIRTGLGYTTAQSNALEDGTLKPKRLCGLALEEEVERRLVEHAREVFWNRYPAGRAALTPTARHLIRLGLGMPAAESLRREEQFASLAAALREVREAHR
jgi:hypothetical protein